ncbi:hypothetical protein Fmac_013785 [Flemingia macrophylla]|uniref:Uncharacterized protein n=1 Tax=Flemingia macrophylla TaxID=520843 RepID=A0ABD1MU68_9FABA
MPESKDQVRVTVSDDFKLSKSYRSKITIPYIASNDGGPRSFIPEMRRRLIKELPSESHHRGRIHQQRGGVGTHENVENGKHGKRTLLENLAVELVIVGLTVDDEGETRTMEKVKGSEEKECFFILEEEAEGGVTVVTIGEGSDHGIVVDAVADGEGGGREQTVGEYEVVGD